MTEKRFTMAEDEYTIEDNSKIISVMTREDILFTLNRLNDENEQLKSILSDTVDHLESRINPNENTKFAVTLIIDGEMYCKIKEVIK